ncbi:MAG: DEAD/DEAH box helicase [Spirochaetaceae bacterium]|jgi:superfamily II DNA/RNA helicase|nr:DEAD/DEAH box helicase [Spirochaetaceae bacterium]
MDFAGLDPAPALLEAFAARGIQHPTGIQKRIIPRLLAGESVLFESPTGTGKTFAYLLPLLRRAGEEQGRPALLVLAPTYELCAQIKGEADFLLASGGRNGRELKTALLIGQANLSRQIETLKTEKPAVIIGNPGRVLLLARMGKLRFRDLTRLVLDEGDRLVADELVAETEALLRLIGRERNGAPAQIAACSATMPPQSRERLLAFMDGAVIDGDDDGAPGKNLLHWAIFCERRGKTAALRSFLAAAKPRKTLVFTSRASEVGSTAARLQHHHWAAAGLHGKMDQRERRRVLTGFRGGDVSVLITSDLAARGLDIGGISHVIALDVPDNENIYLHRAGRTARAGNKGIMVSIGDAEEMRTLARIEKKLGIVVYPKELYGGKITVPESIDP